MHVSNTLINYSKKNNISYYNSYYKNLKNLMNAFIFSKNVNLNVFDCKKKNINVNEFLY